MREMKIKAQRRLVHRSHLYTYRKGICLFDKYHGPILTKNYSLEAIRNIRSKMGGGMRSGGQGIEAYCPTFSASFWSGLPVCLWNLYRGFKHIMPSYSQKASPWQNACIESFHALIKREWLYCFKIKDFNHAYRLVFEYIETFYNTVRSHSHCGFLSPQEFEEYYYAQLKNSLAKVG